MTFAIQDVLAAAQRASAAYESDEQTSQTVFSALGYAWHGLYQNDDHQAVVSSDAQGRAYLSISGTRFGPTAEGLGDLADDLDVSWVDVGLGAQVLKGAYDGCDELFAWAQGLMGPSAWWHVEGHSLGGWRARYAPLFLPADDISQLMTFESPKSANASYYARFAQVFNTRYLGVVNGEDIFVSYPWLSIEACHPPQDWWHLLADGTVSLESPDAWKGGLNHTDHDIALVVQRLTALAAAWPPSRIAGQQP